MRTLVEPRVLFAACGIAGFLILMNSSDSRRVQLGQYEFAIPKENSSTGGKWPWILGLDDDSRSYTLVFPAEELAAAIPGYKPRDGRSREDVRAILNVLNPAEMLAYRDSSRYRDLWEGVGSYSERIIEPYAGRPWFKIYRKSGYPHTWAVVKQEPKAGKSLPDDPLDLWVAGCSVQRSPLTESGEYVRCLTYMVSGDVAVDFYISGVNLPYVENVRAYLISRVEAWRVSEQSS